MQTVKMTLRYRAMKTAMWTIALAMTLALAVGPKARAQDPPPEPKKEEPKIDMSLSNLKIGLTGYIDYSWGQNALPMNQHSNYNTFSATRGYLTVEKSFTPWLGARMTLDIAQDKSDSVKINDQYWDPVTATNKTKTTSYKVADDLEGTYLIRLKYLYAVIKPSDLGPFTNMKVELGMGHVPWLDFEESINPYRCQGTMPIERAGVFASADLGASIMGYFGGELEDAAGKTGNKAYAGKYGSWHVGVFNGPGYTGIEANQNKVFEGRLSLRPLPDMIPGLQLSYFYLTGDGNTKYNTKLVPVTGRVRQTDWPYYRVQMGMISFEHPMVTATAQYFVVDGNAKGTWVRVKKNNRIQDLQGVGYSYFLNVKVPGTDNKLSIWGRYDYFDIDNQEIFVRHGRSESSAYVMQIYGISYDIYKGNLIMLAWEATDYKNDADLKGKLPVIANQLGYESKFQVVYQIKL
jgi:hypothetical protein